jgi:hypothetical protein
VLRLLTTARLFCNRSLDARNTSRGWRSGEQLRYRSATVMTNSEGHKARFKTGRGGSL